MNCYEQYSLHPLQLKSGIVRWTNKRFNADTAKINHCCQRAHEDQEGNLSELMVSTRTPTIEPVAVVHSHVNLLETKLFSLFVMYGVSIRKPLTTSGLQANTSR